MNTSVSSMDPDLKAAWIDALLSGNYKQGTGCLCRQPSEDLDTKQFCCLGVLCDIVDPSGWKPHSSDPEKKTHSEGLTILSESTRDSTGLCESDMIRLATLNDTCQWSFSAIANWIDKKVHVAEPFSDA